MREIRNMALRNDKRNADFWYIACHSNESIMKNIIVTNEIKGVELIEIVKNKTDR